MNDTPSKTKDALRRTWLTLTGGADGCARTRFFLSMLAAATLHALAVRFLSASMMPTVFSLGWGMEFVAIFTLPPMILSGIAGGIFGDAILLLFSKLGILKLIPLPEMLPGGLVAGLSPAYYFISAPVVILSGCVIFGLAWRRLRDAGYSPWNLLAGLWMAVMFGFYTLVGEGVLGTCGDWVLYHLGDLWLLWLYCRPTHKEDALPPAPEES